MRYICPHVPKVRDEVGTFRDVNFAKFRSTTMLMSVDVNYRYRMVVRVLQSLSDGSCTHHGANFGRVVVVLVRNWQVGVGQQNLSMAGFAQRTGDEANPLMRKSMWSAEVNMDSIQEGPGNLE